MTERSAWDDEGKVLLLRQAIEGLAQTKGQEFVHKIEEIIFESHSKKHFDNFLTEPKGNTPEDFVNRVATFYEAHHVEVENLLLYRSEEAWLKLYDTLEKRAYRCLRKVGFYPSQNTQEYAEECSQEAATQLLTSHFHYLSSFESWVAILVRNVCYKKIETDTNYDDLSFEDEWLNFSNLADSEFDHQLLLERLQAALARLSDEEWQFLAWRFLEEPRLTFDQIAVKTGKNLSKVYRLFKKILRKLRGFLDA